MPKSLDTVRAMYWSFRRMARKRLELWRSRFRRDATRECPVCGWRGDEFLLRPSDGDMVCPICHASPRHRVLKLVLDQLHLPPNGSRILHVSPKGEEGLVKMFQARSRRYLSIDRGGVWNAFADGGAMQEMDLRQLPLPDGSFDFVCCNHVLECIPEDEKAIAEIFRVLAPGGAASLLVQLYPGDTVRVDVPTREDYFHAWNPGLDYFDRYRKAGFSVRLFDSDGYDRQRYDLVHHVVVPICTKPASGRSPAA